MSRRTGCPCDYQQAVAMQWLGRGSGSEILGRMGRGSAFFRACIWGEGKTVVCNGAPVKATALNPCTEGCALLHEGRHHLCLAILSQKLGKTLLCRSWKR